MDGLIKGLIDVALGHGDNNEEPNSESREERSRSTWAQVVSGPQDNDEQSSGRTEDYNRGRRNRREEIEEQDERTETAQRHSRRQQEVFYGENVKSNEGAQSDYNREHWNRKEDGEKNNNCWEEVSRKSPKRPHKVFMDHWHGYKRPPSEQEYSNEVDYGTNIEPSEEDLTDLSQACNKLWELDSNRLVPGKDYQIDCGEGKKAYQSEDMAQQNLFYWVKEDIFRKPTYSRFCSLLDNYNPNVGCKEVITPEERQEQTAFIEEISRTAPIKYLHKYLALKGIISENYQDFKRIMIDLWFELCFRGGSSSSSAFEHVFVGEIKQHGENEVSGFHNWLQFYLEEAKGRVDYQGYILPRRRGEIPDSEIQLLKIQFEWNGILKSVSSIFIGVSPEFEIALYTLCFFVGGEDNYVQLGPYPVNIKCYRYGNGKIGSVFPTAES